MISGAPKPGGVKVPQGSRGGFDWRVILSALSSALPMIAQSRAARHQQDDLLAGQAEIQRQQQRADAMVGDQVSEISASNPDADKARALADYSAAVARNKASAGSAAPTPTLGGGRSSADRKVATQAGDQYARQQATFAAGVDAPSRQREREGISANRRAGDIKAIGQPIGTAAFLAKLRANRRTPSPWAALASQLGGAVANNYVMEDEQMNAPGPGKDPNKIPTGGGRGSWG